MNAKGRVPGVMNGTEKRLLNEKILPRVASGEILWWMYEGIKFNLAEPRCTYTPDFDVMLADGTIEIWECKGGFTREDAQIKLKVAASLFPFVFRKCVWKDGKWTITEVGRPAEKRDDEIPAKAPERWVVRKTPQKSDTALLNGKPISVADALKMIQK